MVSELWAQTPPAGSGGDPSIFISIVSALAGVMKWFDNMQMPSFCWACPIYRVVFEVINYFTNQISGQLQAYLKLLCAMALLFIIAYKVLINMVRLNGMDATAFLADIFKSCTKLLVALLLLVSLNSLFIYGLEPLLNMSIAFANKLQSLFFGGDISSATGVSHISLDALNTTLRNMGKAPIAIGDCSNIDCGATGVILGNKLCNNMVQMICTFNSSVVAGIAIAGMLIVGGVQVGITALPLIIVGLLIGFLGYGNVLIKVPLKLIDPLIRIGFVCALSPLFILLWMIPATASYTHNAFRVFISSCFQIFFVSMMTLFAIVMLEFSLGAGTQVDFIKQLIDGKDFASVVQSMGAGLMILIWAWLSCYLAAKFLDMSSQLANFFAGTPEFGEAFAERIGQYGAMAIRMGGNVLGGIKNGLFK